MPLTYRRPGVYLEESLLSSAGDVSNATSVAMFVGAASKGPANEPVRVETWGDYTAIFGGFDVVPNSSASALSYLPYSVYSYFQNGGRTAYVVRSVPTSGSTGSASTVTVTGVPFAGGSATTAFILTARSVGVWGSKLSYILRIQETTGTSPVTECVFTLQIALTTNGVTEIVENFTNLSVTGTLSGTRSVSSAINDPVSGSRYVQVSTASTSVVPAEALTAVPLANGTNPGLPDAGTLTGSATTALPQVDGPVVLNIVGYTPDISTVDTASWGWVGTTLASSAITDRQDIFIVNDNCAPRVLNQTVSAYKTLMLNSSNLGANPGDSYSASYGPWIVISNPLRPGAVMAIPPGGAVMGMMARIDATMGVSRAPAGVVAGLSNAIGVQAKFTDSDLGDINSSNVNVIRSVVGSGIAVMGARTRKSYGADRYVSARRTLIYVREVLRRSTQFAVFENNDSRLWGSLRMAAERILRPLWESGGLRGANAAEAYYIRCDETINTSAVISAGEVRMEIGVALEYPAEFVIIRVSQFDRGQFTTEVTARA